uniref:Uncharacterized protein n=1 Tax=Glossina austeni TaxID=7395 RepID=A0A1A9VW99_GLOAU
MAAIVLRFNEKGNIICMVRALQVGKVITFVTSDVFDEIDLSDVCTAECSIKNVNHSFQISVYHSGTIFNFSHLLIVDESILTTIYQHYSCLLFVNLFTICSQFKYLSTRFNSSIREIDDELLLNFHNPALN